MEANGQVQRLRQEGGGAHRRVLLPQLHIKLNTGPLLHQLLQDGCQIVVGGGVFLPSAARNQQDAAERHKFGKSGAKMWRRRAGRAAANIWG